MSSNLGGDGTGAAEGAAVVPLSAGGVLAAASTPLVADALAVLDEALGRVQVGWADGQRVYTRRIELLARAVTPECFAMVLDWLSSTTRTSVNTKRAYVDDIRGVWALLALELGRGRFFVGCLTSADVRLWRLRQEGAGVAAATIARRINTLSSLHDHAAPRMIPSPDSPVAGKDDRPRIDRSDVATATPILEVDGVQRLADAAAASDDPRDLLLVQLLYTLAARVGEISDANVTDHRTDGHRRFLDLIRKGDKLRSMPLTPVTSELLDLYTGGRTTGPLLLDADGQRLDRHDIARILTRLGHHAGVLDGRDVTPHVLRASRITHMLDDGVPLADVQAFADHADPATTLLYWRRRDKTARNIVLADAADTVLAHASTAWLGRRTPPPPPR